MARARWHFGGGPTYCAGCRAEGLPCADGRPGVDDQLCPYVEHAPMTVEGWEAWDVLSKCSGQLRLVPMGGVIGLDLGAALACGQALGYEPSGLAELLPAGEAGLVTALNDRMTRED